LELNKDEEIFTGKVIFLPTSLMYVLVGLLMIIWIWSPPTLFMVLPWALTCLDFFAVVGVENQNLTMHSRA
jgi:hypothetical protein